MNEKQLYEFIKKCLSYNSETGAFTWVDRISKFSNIIGSDAGYLTKRGYLYITFNGKGYFGHRIAWLLHYGYMPKFNIDHINGIKNDNRIINLRECTQSENAQNKKNAQKNNSTGYLGVYKKGLKFAAQIKHDKKTIYLGEFNDPKIAHEVYLNKKRELHPFCTI